MTPLTKHVMPNGVPIYYRDNPYHQYYGDARETKDGLAGVGRLDGVSTVAKVYDTGSTDGLLQWAVNLDRQGIADIAADGMDCLDAEDALMALVWLRSAETIGRALEEGEATWKHVRDRAGTRGTNVHKHALEALADGGRVNFAEMTEEEVGYARAVAGFWLDADPEPLFSEQVVGDVDLGAAGRLDLIARIDGVTTLIDAKTGKYVGASAAVQQAGYRLLAERAGYPVPERMMLLHVKPDGTYDPVYVEAEEQDFLDALRVHKRAKVIGKQMREAVKAYARA